MANESTARFIAYIYLYIYLLHVYNTAENSLGKFRRMGVNLVWFFPFYRCVVLMVFRGCILKWFWNQLSPSDEWNLENNRHKIFFMGETKKINRHKIFFMNETYKKQRTPNNLDDKKGRVNELLCEIGWIFLIIPICTNHRQYDRSLWPMSWV